jgi:hypothetical protein
MANGRVTMIYMHVLTRGARGPADGLLRRER